MKFLSTAMALFLLVSSSINAQFKRKNEIDNLLTSISKNNPLPTFVAGGVNKTGVFYQYNHGNKIWSGKTPINENHIYISSENGFDFVKTNSTSNILNNPSDYLSIDIIKDIGYLFHWQDKRFAFND